MNKKELTQFVQIAKSPISYTVDRKNDFARLGKKLARHIAKALNLTKDEFSIRWNPGGIAVSGDITLHADHIYIDLGQSCLGDQFMYRACKSQKDYTGGVNQWMDWDDLLDIDKAIAKFKQTMAIGFASESRIGYNYSHG